MLQFEIINGNAYSFTRNAVGLRLPARCVRGDVVSCYAEDMAKLNPAYDASEYASGFSWHFEIGVDVILVPATKAERKQARRDRKFGKRMMRKMNEQKLGCHGFDECFDDIPW